MPIFRQVLSGTSPCYFGIFPLPALLVSLVQHWGDYTEVDAHQGRSQLFEPQLYCFRHYSVWIRLLHCPMQLSSTLQQFAPGLPQPFPVGGISQEERQAAVPNHEQCFSPLPLLLLLLHHTHSIPWHGIAGGVPQAYQLLTWVNDGITTHHRWKTQQSVCIQPAPSPRVSSTSSCSLVPLEPSSPCVKASLCPSWRLWRSFWWS